MTLLMLAVWVLLVALTVGPVFSALRDEPESGWLWLGAALLLGPLAGLAYCTSRHAMRKVAARHGELPAADVGGRDPAPPGGTAHCSCCTHAVAERPA